LASVSPGYERPETDRKFDVVAVAIVDIVDSFTIFNDLGKCFGCDLNL
jgi:hypothetical protein